MRAGDRHSAVTRGTDASKSAMRSLCAWHQFGGPWGNASHWLTRPGDRHSVVTRGTDASKGAMRSSCAWHQFGGPWSNASHWLMQPGDRHSAAAGGQMLAKVRCVRHVPGTSLGAIKRGPRLPRSWCMGLSKVLKARKHTTACNTPRTE